MRCGAAAVPCAVGCTAGRPKRLISLWPRGCLRDPLSIRSARTVASLASIRRDLAFRALLQRSLGKSTVILGAAAVLEPDGFRAI